MRALIKTFGLGETLERKDQMRDAVEAVWGELERGRREESSKERASEREGGREGEGEPRRGREVIPLQFVHDFC